MTDIQVKWNLDWEELFWTWCSAPEEFELLDQETFVEKKKKIKSFYHQFLSLRTKLSLSLVLN